LTTEDGVPGRLIMTNAAVTRTTEIATEMRTVRRGREAIALAIEYGLLERCLRGKRR